MYSVMEVPVPLTGRGTLGELALVGTSVVAGAGFPQPAPLCHRLRVIAAGVCLLPGSLNCISSDPDPAGDGSSCSIPARPRVPSAEHHPTGWLFVPPSTGAELMLSSPSPAVLGWWAAVLGCGLCPGACGREGGDTLLGVWLQPEEPCGS